MTNSGLFTTEDERIAAEWIKGNPHVAIRLAVEAHNAKDHTGWHGCTCVFNRLTVGPSTTVYITDELEATR